MLERLIDFLGSRLFAGLVCLALAAGVWFGLAPVLEACGWDPKAIFLFFPVKVGLCIVLGATGLWHTTVAIGQMLS